MGTGRGGEEVVNLCLSLSSSLARTERLEQEESKVSDTLGRELFMDQLLIIKLKRSLWSLSSLPSYVSYVQTGAPSYYYIKGPVQRMFPLLHFSNFISQNYQSEKSKDIVRSTSIS